MRVVVVGAGGRMGREVVRAVHGAEDMVLVGGVDPVAAGEDLGELARVGTLHITVGSNLAQELDEKRPDAVVDFTSPDVVLGNMKTAIAKGVRAVVGTTGLDLEDLDSVSDLAEKAGVGVVVAPNFAIGAVLLMRFAQTAAAYFPDMEIIELHHEKKKDAPSGTALKTAEMIAAGRREEGSARPEGEFETVQGARGGRYEGLNIHSVRLPGLVAHQEVLMGLPGQLLTLRHDSTSRESFMPGVLLALRKVARAKGLIYGLEHLLFEGESGH